MRTIKLNKDREVLVDDEDYEYLNQFKWGNIGTKFIYAARGTRINGKYYKILMHRVIMKVNDKTQIVDHINGNTLDNRRCNLRITNRCGNSRNSLKRSDGKSIYKGVSVRYKSKKGQRFEVRIQISSEKRIYLGYFKTEVDAAKAYNDAAIKYFGEFAKLNNIK